MRSALLTLILMSPAVCSGESKEGSREATSVLAAQVRESTQHARDYFVFACVDAYLRINKIPQYDSSTELEENTSFAGAAAIGDLAEHAYRVAAAIKPRAGQVHPAVGATCLREARLLNFSAPLTSRPQE